MTDHAEDERPAYNPENPQLPAGEPPLRSTAPQSDFTGAQVRVGFLVLVVGLALTAGLATVLV